MLLHLRCKHFDVRQSSRGIRSYADDMNVFICFIHVFFKCVLSLLSLSSLLFIVHLLLTMWCYMYII